MSPEELTRQSERYVEAKEYASLVEFPGWIRLSEKIGKDMARVLEIVSTTGYPSKDEEHEALLEVRATKRLLDFVSKSVLVRDRIAKTLADAGIPIDAEK